MFFFGCHNYMQELIMNLPGFKVRHLECPRIFPHLIAIFLFSIVGGRLSWIP